MNLHLYIKTTSTQSSSNSCWKEGSAHLHSPNPARRSLSNLLSSAFLSICSLPLLFAMKGPATPISSAYPPSSWNLLSGLSSWWERTHPSLQKLWCFSDWRWESHLLSTKLNCWMAYRRQTDLEIGWEVPLVPFWPSSRISSFSFWFSDIFYHEWGWNWI